MKFTARQILIAVAVVAVAGMLLVSRFSGGTSGVAIQAPAAPGNSSTEASPDPSVPAAPSSGTPTTDEHDDGADDDAPILVTPTTKPDVREAGIQFAAAWLNTYGQNPASWRAGLTPRVTPDLAEDLAYADPESVPAGGRVADPVTVTAEGALFNVDAPVVTADTKAQPLGILNLTLLNAGGKWLVSEIDWQAS